MFTKIKNLIPARFKNTIKAFLSSGAGGKVDFNSYYSYPQNWISLQKPFFGQYGEDFKILSLFSGKTDGYFVEIGAMEGVRFSNTFFFEKLGWKGICIEPHPDYIDLLKKNRPNSVVISAAVGKEDKGAVDFYTNYRGSLSTLNKELEGYFQSHYQPYFGGFKKIQVPLVSLNTVLMQNKAPIGFELLSIDTEGTEGDVLAGFDIGKYKPKVVIVELSIKREPVLEYMQVHGYVLACENPSNAIFCRNEEEANMVRYTNIIGEQVYTEHPLDHQNVQK